MNRTDDEHETPDVNDRPTLRAVRALAENFAAFADETDDDREAPESAPRRRERVTGRVTRASGCSTGKGRK